MTAKAPPPPELRGQPLAGPYPNIGAFCEARHQQGCYPNEFFGDVHAVLEKVRPPWRSVRLFATGDQARQTYYLALETQRGFYVQEIGDSNNDLALVEFAQRDDAGTPGPVVLRLGTATVLTPNQSLDQPARRCVDHLAVCGLGPSGGPSCVTLVAAVASCKDHDRVTKSAPLAWDWEVKLKLWPGEAEFEVRGGKDAPAKLAGRHRLVFP